MIIFDEIAGYDCRGWVYICPAARSFSADARAQRDLYPSLAASF